MFLLCVTYALGLRGLSTSAVQDTAVHFTTSGRVEPQRLKVCGKKVQLTSQHSRSHQLAEILVCVCLQSHQEASFKASNQLLPPANPGHQSHNSSKYGRWQSHGSAGVSGNHTGTFSFFFESSLHPWGKVPSLFMASPFFQLLICR